MTDRLTELLEHTADAWSRGPLPAPPQVQQRRARTWLAPALAAAACVAIVAAAAGVATHRGSDAPAFADLGPPVPVDLQAVPREDDAGLPTVGPTLPAPPCTPEDVRARFEGSGLLVSGTGRSCRLPEGLTPLGGTELRVTQRVQPDVPNPPQFGGRGLFSQGITSAAAWTGACPEAGAVLLMAPGWRGTRVPVTGRPSGCGGTADPALALGPAHRSGVPGGSVTADRAGLQLTLTAPERTIAGGRLDFALAVRNPTSTPIALRPCPTFVFDLHADQGGWGSGIGRFPCDRLPELLRPQTELTLGFGQQLPTPTAGQAGGPASLTLTIAGARTATTTLEIAPAVITERVTIPYAAPSPGYRPPFVRGVGSRSGAFPIQITAPTSVRAGDVLRYRAVLTLPPDEGLSLSPCPGWRESFYPAPSTGAAKSAAGSVARTGPVTCSQAPAALKAGSEVTFEMELSIPADTQPGPYQVVWQLLNGLNSAPFDFTVTG